MTGREVAPLVADVPEDTVPRLSTAFGTFTVLFMLWAFKGEVRILYLKGDGLALPVPPVSLLLALVALASDIVALKQLILSVASVLPVTVRPLPLPLPYENPDALLFI